MTSASKRPVHLNLLSIHMPVTAVVSITHRLCGVLMVLALPFGIYLLQLSLDGAEGFARVRRLLDNGWIELGLFFLAWGLLHHLFAGLRFLAIDLDLGVGRDTARKTAWVAAIGAAIGAVFVGFML